VASSTYKTFLRPGKDLKKFGKWAVITGATDGIGLAYAHALAKKGISIVLISRTESKLQQVQQEVLSKNYPGVEVQYIVCDYSKFDAATKTAVKTKLEALDIGILINNVGISYRYPLFFHELTEEEVTTLLTINIDSVVYMTRMVLPGMIQRKRGTIVNISSGSALYTLPLLAMYSGSKSFVEKFSRAINAEYRTQGISCQCQVPFYVATKLAKMRPSLTVPSPSSYVKMAIKWIGYSNNAIVQPFWIHAVQGYIMHYVPDSIIATVIMGMHLSIRKKGIKKDARIAEEAKNKAK
jgi:17beta-estradiol 17-dehydrogenase / very-long-chain 3-oxoacyl-CoA reductase